MATVDITSLRKTINPKALQNLAYGAALSKLNRIRSETLNDFDNHPVTVELKAGEGADSTSLPDGNLFSFIGFTQGETPTQDVREVLETQISIQNKPAITQNQNIYTFSFPAAFPSKQDIESVSPMPSRWSSGSWVTRIEKGISGLQHYIYGVFQSSFSTTGLQVKGKVRKDVYKPRKYISEILKKALAKF
jgi:hypothetical protein